MNRGNKVDRWWLDYSLRCVHTGSRVICDPPVMDTDDDYLLLVDIEVVDKLILALQADGFKIGGSRPARPLKEFPSIENIERDDGVFQSLKKDGVNVLVTASHEYFENFVKATFLCRKLNLTEKEDRIEVFQSICCDSWTCYPKLMLKGAMDGI